MKTSIAKLIATTVFVLSFSLMSTTASAVDFPIIEMPTLNVPSIELPTFEIPNIELPTFDISLDLAPPSSDDIWTWFGNEGSASTD